MSPQPTQSLQPDKKHSFATEFQTLLCLITGHSTVVHFIKYGFTHITSSLRYPHAKSEVECAVATVKGLWKGGGEKTTSFFHPYIKRFRSPKIEQMKKNMAVQSARPSKTLQSGQSIWLLREESQGAVICQAKTNQFLHHTHYWKTGTHTHTTRNNHRHTDMGRAPYATSSGRVSYKI